MRYLDFLSPIRPKLPGTYPVTVGWAAYPVLISLYRLRYAVHHPAKYRQTYLAAAGHYHCISRKLPGTPQNFPGRLPIVCTDKSEPTYPVITSIQ